MIRFFKNWEIFEPHLWKHSRKYFNAKCINCGKNKCLPYKGILNQKTKPCGCGSYRSIELCKSNKRFIDLTGKRFGKLYVEGIDENRFYTRPQLYWKVICDCGFKKTVRSCSLKKSTRSCGCLQKSKARESGKKTYKGFNVRLINDIFSSYKRHAKARSLVFNISMSDFKILIKTECFYCGRTNVNKHINKRNSEELIYNGIDRINSDIGYIKGNIVSCCGRCNTAKLDYSVKEFYDWINLVYNNLNIKGLLYEK